MFTTVILIGPLDNLTGGFVSVSTSLNYNVMKDTLSALVISHSLQFLCIAESTDILVI